jgi:hypothetical protein
VRCFDEISARPAVQQGMKVLAFRAIERAARPESLGQMFGKTRFQRR